MNKDQRFTIECMFGINKHMSDEELLDYAIDSFGQLHNDFAKATQVKHRLSLIVERTCCKGDCSTCQDMQNMQLFKRDWPTQKVYNKALCEGREITDNFYGYGLRKKDDVS